MIMLNEYFQLGYSDLLERLKQPATQPLKPLRVAVLRNVMLEPIETYWKFLARSAGFLLEVKFGQYDQILPEALGAAPAMLNAQTDIVHVFCYLETLSQSLTRRFAAMNKDQLQEECDRIEVFCRSVISGIRTQTAAAILWHGFEIPVHAAMGIMESMIEGQQADMIRQLNEKVKTILFHTENAYYVNLDLCLSRIGAKAFYDKRYWHIGHAPYSREAYREIAFEDFKYVRALKAKNKKCLVLDCDNTLWGGIVGEEGVDKIHLSKTHPGSAYYEFQQEILNLYDRGIILALCSKNNENDVWEVFRSHPDMVLKEEHIAAYQINWDDKATNMRRLANQLNIGTDSMVFIDDNEFELALIRQVLPEVEALSLAGKSPIEYRSLLAECGLFDVLNVTEEDRKRGRMYREDSQRKKLAETVVDLSVYLRSLQMHATLRLADDFAVSRISQLTQRTNQFNLTTRRYLEHDVQLLLKDELAEVLTLDLKDRFGDMGMVGVCILRYQSDHAQIDTLLLSCRAFGRRAEDVLLTGALQLARDYGVKKIKTEYLPTAKNGIASNFYEQKGFKMISENAGCKIYEYSLLDAELVWPQDMQVTMPTGLMRES